MPIGASTNRGIINIYMALLATFVGVGKHADPGIRDLIGATRDAVAMHALFVDTISDLQADLLVDSNATLEAIRRSLRRTLGSATDQDSVIFYFSGHGSHDHRMAASDTRLADLAATTLPMQELADEFKQSKAKAVFCVLDCCFSGSAPGKVLEDTPIPRDPGSPLPTLAGDGRVLLSACSENEGAYEHPRSRHGLLSKALLDIFLSASAAVDVLTITDEVMRVVRAEAARMGVIQTPVIFGTVQGGFTIPKLSPGTLFKAAFPEYRDAIVSRNIDDLRTVGIPGPVVDEWKLRYPSGLNALQLSAINNYRILDGNSLLVVAPTSAGKTFIGELAAARSIAENRKAVFLLPYKALVNEKHDQFKDLYGKALGMRVVRCSGDFSDDVGAFLKGKYDLALLTYEMFLQLAVNNPTVLIQLGLVVVDEAQFITDGTRGITVELLLTLLIAARERGVCPQLLCLSAVIGDVNRFHEWLGCDLLMTTERPVPLVEGVIDRYGTFQFVDEAGVEATVQLLEPHQVVVRRDKPSAQDVIVPLVSKLVKAGEKVIVFRNARGPAQGCAKYLADDLGLPAAEEALAALPSGDLSGASTALRECLSGGTAFHNSNLTRDERVTVEQSFRRPDGAIRVLAATTTVAAGINTPASTVILAENEFLGEDGRPFSVAEYKNMAGRAGRLGFNEKGRAIILAENQAERRMLFEKYVRGRLERLESSFNAQDVETWLIRLLAQVRSIPKTEVPRLLVNTFGGFLSVAHDPRWMAQTEAQITGLIARMISLGLLETQGDTVSLSMLGRACGRSSLKLESSLRLVELIKSVPDPLLNAGNLVAIIQALPSDEMGYTPMMKKGTRESVRRDQAAARYGNEIVGILQRYAYDHLEFLARCKRAAVLYDWIHGVKIESIEEEFSTTQYFYRIEHGDIRRFADLTRFHLRSAADLLSILLLGRTQGEEIDLVVKQLEIGLPASALPLLDLPIDLSRGECLGCMAAGLVDPDSVWKADPLLMQSILGKQRSARLESFRPPQV